MSRTFSEDFSSHTSLVGMSLESGFELGSPEHGANVGPSGDGSYARQSVGAQCLGPLSELRGICET